MPFSLLHRDSKSCIDSRERPGLRHDSQANLVASQQNGGFLPGHGSELDFMFMI
jgi:hypothetical protein